MFLNENHLLISLIMIEVLCTIIFLTVVAVGLYLRRYFIRKPLNGCTALITNGDTNLAQELAMQLTSKYNCNVVLIKGKRTGNQKLSLNPNGISTCHCDILENDELEELSQHIHETLGGIDIVIDNGVIEQQSIKNEDCRTFVDSTGEKLRSTINLLMHFIPKMKDSPSGHFVTIQSIKPDKRPVLSSYREIKQLINHLTDEQPIFALEMFSRQKIRLTTVFWEQQTDSSSNGCSNNNDSNQTHNISEHAERIVDSIRANRNAVHIRKTSNSLHFISKYFSKKIKTNENPIKL